MAGSVEGLPALKRKLLVVGVAVGYSALAVATEPWTWYSRIFTSIAGAWGLWLAVRRGWHRIRRDEPVLRVDQSGALGLMIWTLLVSVMTGWLLAVFYSEPRAVYPTLSYLMNIAFANYPIRVLGFSAWLALGWYLMRR